ncbi:helicase-exonuclease AddAB subunit AddB [Evansella clarkii]|uniref:helicase-exonuclease AddAB subunit AddB n=1 Tax=Evansella clarkii TaxID=79879 RepID=UPI000996A67E|nr:helicase-exonuclease AddAB subunit AddB [Evansella clarkii]
MSVTLYLGRAGTGKTTAIINEICEKSISEPTGRPIIYIVPEQMTFQSEMALVNTKQKGMTRAQVLSFSRLALRVLQETGGISRYFIERTGIHMLLRKIIERKKESFRVFSKATDTNGFIDQLEQMLSELKKYDISLETLNENYEHLKSKENKRPQEFVLEEKLHDMHIIFSMLEQELAGKYLGSEDYLSLLAEQIHKSEYIREAEIYIDGFHSFTPLELKVFEQLIIHSRGVVTALTLDRNYESGEILNELDLFFETAGSSQVIKQICKANDTEINEPVMFFETKRFKTPALAHLEKYNEVRPPVQREDSEGIHLIAAVNQRSEVEGVAREILQLVRDKSYRYNDIVILLRNMNDYMDLLETIFEDYEIPLFMDKKRSMLNHPVIEFIRSSLDIIHGHWRYEAVFRCLKTDLLYSAEEDTSSMRERVDQLENYVLSYGIQGSRWYSKEPWTYRRIRTTAEDDRGKTEAENGFEQEINLLREQLTAPLIVLEKRMKRAKSIQERCEVLYKFLDENNIPEKLERMRDKATESNDLQSAREHDQVWSAVIDLLDQMVEMAGEEKVSFDLFRNMLDTGLESMEFSIIPPAIDQVIVADMSRSRVSNVRCAFIMGVNEGVIPAKPEEGGIIAEDEREFLQSEGMNLAPGNTSQLLNESFLIYLAQSTPSECLYFTYPLADTEGKSMQPSIILRRLTDTFPKLEEKLWLHEPTDMTEKEQLHFISSPVRTLSYLSYQLQSWKKGYPVPEFWWDVYNWYAEKNDWERPLNQVIESLYYKNEAKQLPKETSQELYGTHILTSVSRMEQHQQCPYAQFVNYGLKLRDRETYKLEAPDVGTLFHAALKEMADFLRKQGRDFSNLTKGESKKLAKRIVAELAPKIQREILLSSNKYNYIKQKLEEVVARASAVLAEQSRASGFSPIGLEVAFGPGQELPPLTFNLGNGCTMELVGRIDRVDKSQDSSKGLLLRVIDYKSSKKDIRLTDVYYGLALQMLIYLDVIVSFSEQWLGAEASPAGVLYFHVHNPLVQSNESLTADQIEEALFKEFKMKGLLSADPEIVRMMDYEIGDSGGRSKIIPAGLKKNGEFYAGSSVISENDYSALRNYLRNKVAEIGRSITDGVIDITPVKEKQKNACTFCSYRSLCQFDPSIETNEFRRLPKMETDEILEKMRREGGENDEGKS